MFTDGGCYSVDAPVVLAGDYNVVPTDADIYATKSYKNNALVQPEPRVLFSFWARRNLTFENLPATT